jgi:hypothetical protein
MVVKKNNLEWLDDNKKLHFSVERLFTRDGDFDKTALNQEGAFVDILRVVNFTFFLLMKSSLFFPRRCFELNSIVLLIHFFIFLVEIMLLIIPKP